jgi:hypothetical protein
MDCDPVHRNVLALDHMKWNPNEWVCMASDRRLRLAHMALHRQKLARMVLDHMQRLVHMAWGRKLLFRLQSRKERKPMKCQKSQKLKSEFLRLMSPALGSKLAKSKMSLDCRLACCMGCWPPDRKLALLHPERCPRMRPQLQ